MEICSKCFQITTLELVRLYLFGFFQPSKKIFEFILTNVFFMPKIQTKFENLVQNIDKPVFLLTLYVFFIQVAVEKVYWTISMCTYSLRTKKKIKSMFQFSCANSNFLKQRGTNSICQLLWSMVK